MTRTPGAPFLEFSFYSWNRPESDLFAELARDVMQSGGRLTGSALAFVRRQDEQCDMFGSISDDRVEEITFPQDSVLDLLADTSLCVVQLEVCNASGIYGDMLEKLTYSGIPTSLVGHERHPVAIWTDGQPFAFEQPSSEESRAYGLRAYTRFRHLAQVLDPEYAAITVAEPIPTLAELREESIRAPFLDFYVSRKLGKQTNDEIKEIMRGAYIEDLEKGTYVSSTPHFNPDQMSTPFSMDYQRTVACLIADAYP